MDMGVQFMVLLVDRRFLYRLNTDTLFLLELFVLLAGPGVPSYGPA